MMSELDQIKGALRSTAKRQRWHRGWRGFWAGFFAGCLGWVLAFLVYKVAPVQLETVLWSGLMVPLAAAVGFAAMYYRKPGLAETARWVDEKEHLQERLSTALELAEQKRSGDWHELVVRDAVRWVDRIRPAQLIRFDLPRAARWSSLILILGVGLGFVPEFRSERYLQAEREKEVMEDVGKRLSTISRHQLQKEKPYLPPTEKSMQTVAELGDTLAKAKLSTADALKQVANVTDQLKEQTRDLRQNPGLKRMERAARTGLENSAASGAELEKRMEALRQELGNQAENAEGLNKMQKALEDLKKAAQGAQEGGEAGEAAKAAMSKNLADLMQQAQEMGLALPDLEAALEALQAGDTGKFLKDLDMATLDLEKMASMAEALQQLEAQAMELGRDLGEQLEKGQAPVAQWRLQKMAEELRSGDLTEEKLQEILKEVKAAVGPAGDYGKVQDLLKEAVERMQAGERMEAAQALEAAAQELENLMEQMADCENLQEMLMALQKAGMCLGTGQCWGKAGYPKAGQGGKPGAGVGTWADDSQMLDMSELQQRWDNSGVERGDMEARGVSDRGEGKLPENMAATKVSGKMSPGEAMPSIALKGVSIRGVSQVELEQIAAGAQSEAEQALNQDQVPRAYQGAVKSYFDDLQQE